MKFTIDSVVMILSLAFIGFMGYMIVSTTLLYRNEYDRGCWNGAAQFCEAGGCPDTIFMAAYNKCMLGKNR